MITYLQVENLSKYWGELALFDGISFSVIEGQKVAMIAKNGAGKSTLMDIMRVWRHPIRANQAYQTIFRSDICDRIQTLIRKIRSLKQHLIQPVN